MEWNQHAESTQSAASLRKFKTNAWLRPAINVVHKRELNEAEIQFSSSFDLFELPAFFRMKLQEHVFLFGACSCSAFIFDRDMPNERDI